jgi:hypothetical protein
MSSSLQTTILYGYSNRRSKIPVIPFAYLLLLNPFRGLDASLEAADDGAHPGWVTTVACRCSCRSRRRVRAAFGYSFADLGNPLLGGDYPVLSSQIYLAIGQYDIPRRGARDSLWRPRSFSFFQEAPAARTVRVGRWAGLAATFQVNHPPPG